MLKIVSDKPQQWTHFRKRRTIAAALRPSVGVLNNLELEEEDLKKIAFVLLTVGIGVFGCSGSGNKATDGSSTADGSGSTSTDGNVSDAGATDGASRDGAADGVADGASKDSAVTVDAVPSDGPAVTIDAAAPVTAMITKATGGTVALGAASVAIPAGALAADTTLTVSAAAPDASLPNSGLIKGMVYDFGPNGTEFLKPVDLTLPVVGTVPTGSEAVVSYFDTNSHNWIDLPTTVSGTNVIAKTTHFTKFAVRFVITGAVCAYETPCGGDVNGTWEFTDICVGSTKPTTNGACGNDTSTGSVTAAASASGTIVVANGRYTLALTLVFVQEVRYGAACLSALQGNNQIAACKDLEAKLSKGDPNSVATCDGTVATGCHCVVKVTQVNPQEMGTIVTSGTNATFTKDGSATGDVDPYCVQGNIWQARGKDGTVYTVRKK